MKRERKNMKKYSNKGISLISLGITVVLILIVTGTLVLNGMNALKIKSLDNLYIDLGLLQDKINSYQSKKGELPLLQSYTNTGMITQNVEVKNPNDGDDYYVIDLEVLENVSLNYGEEYDKIKGQTGKDDVYEDIYIVNKKSQTVYYPKGIQLNGATYYRDQEEYSKVDTRNRTNKILIVFDPEAEVSAEKIVKDYFAHVDVNPSATIEDVINGDYDVIVSSGKYGGSGRADLLNQAFEAGKAVFSTGNDCTVNNQIIKDSIAYSGSYTTQKVLDNKITKNMENSIDIRRGKPTNHSFCRGDRSMVSR